jgi:uncharacterized repeat protein (TIGR03803 family)
MTRFGGGSVNGSLFRIKTDGTGYEKLRAFTGSGGDGGNPVASLVRGPDGTLYGTTSAGGGRNQGTAFRINYPEVTTPPVRLDATRLGDGTLRLSWTNSTSGTMETSTNLTPNSWSPAGAPTQQPDGSWRLDVSPGDPVRFYRFRSQ